MELYHKLYLFLKIGFVFVYLLVRIKILKTEPEIEFLLEDIIKFMVTFFCLYIFWPFRRKYQIKKHDRYFGFSAGIFLLISTKIFKSNNYIPVLQNLFYKK
tara:strand:- start:268 stop:570 length:303 start_codon:yes stop_codon:yes gene_type:complete